MAITYAGLIADIKAYTENDAQEFVDSIPRFIRNAELRIYREADLDVFRKYATTNLISGNRYLPKPTDIVIDRYLKILVNGEKRDVWPKDPSFVSSYWTDEAETAVPKWYADWDHNTFVLGPIPDSNYTATLAYTYRPTGLGTSTSTTWLSSFADDVLLYATLIEAHLFMKHGVNPESSQINEWRKEYARALGSLVDEERRRQRREVSRHGEERN